MIYVVGMGPGLEKYLTLEAKEIIDGAEVLYARTEEHEFIDLLKQKGRKVVSFDKYYEVAETFEEVYKKIVDDLVSINEKADVCYLVPGNPAVFEKTADLLSERLGENQVSLIHGASFLDVIFTRLKIDPLKGLSLIDSLDMENINLPDKGFAVFCQCYDRMIASDVKLRLSEFIDDESEIYVINSIGSQREAIIKLPLFELDRREIFGHETSILVEI